jgi:hypothetical protein
MDNQTDFSHIILCTAVSPEAGTITCRCGLSFSHTDFGKALQAAREHIELQLSQLSLNVVIPDELHESLLEAAVDSDRTPSELILDGLYAEVGFVEDRDAIEAAAKRGT